MSAGGPQGKGGLNTHERQCCSQAVLPSSTSTFLSTLHRGGLWKTGTNTRAGHQEEEALDVLLLVGAEKGLLFDGFWV